MAETSFALYRKYRPDSFASVRNQDHIVSVLEGAIKKGMIPHALLFTGSRGTGKTTVARIFAHAIGASDIDIYEIDAASNRGIDDIRALKEAVYTLPYESPYKVYIIDEVHMLTKEAWNALLKTLEEPPEYVVFILATTEQDKILDTIISRCQVFTFRAPTRDELTEIVLDVAKKESFTLSRGGAAVIALAANGSYRDALSIMQKIIMASGDTKLDEDEIARIVGAPKGILIVDFIEAIHTKNLERAMGALQSVLDAHVDMRIFLPMLLERIRVIMLLRHGVMKEDALTEYTPGEQELLLTCAKDTKSPINSAFLLKLLEASDRTASSHIPTLPLELAVIEALN
jgi:DNA polymerase III subunit gamma/tau